MKTKRLAVVLQQRILLELKLCYPQCTNMEKSHLHSTVDKRWRGIITGFDWVSFSHFKVFSAMNGNGSSQKSPIKISLIKFSFYGGGLSEMEWATYTNKANLDPEDLNNCISVLGNKKLETSSVNIKTWLLASYYVIIQCLWDSPETKVMTMILH